MTNEQIRRRDLAIIEDLIPPHARVLDLGCGSGTFLRTLMENKGVRGLGVEIEQPLISNCIANGVHVIQGNLDDPLTFADDDSFDVVVLSHTLQQVKHPDELLREIVRVGKRAVVSVINFGYLPCRTKLMFTGRMPETEAIPYHWYDTPNIHFSTLSDFQNLCNKLGIAIVRKIPVGSRHSRWAQLAPNLLAQGCVYELEKRHKKSEDKI
ncbi:MAG: methionine biosynthesis protein MetW [Lentisphaeria bacterium]|nr:methionine biosynthesis protein MetW [Lentisphaeria bacterium]